MLWSSHILGKESMTDRLRAIFRRPGRQEMSEMRFASFSKDTRHYRLADGWALESAPEREFGIAYAVYRRANPEFFQTYLEYGSDLAGLHYCFWVRKDCQRVGGIIIRPNHIEGLFVIPPFAGAYDLLVAVQPILLHWSDAAQDTMAEDVLPHEVDLYHRLGFRADCIRRHMIRPTESFGVSWDPSLELESPGPQHESAIASLCCESFSGGVAKYGRYTLDEWRARFTGFAEREKHGSTYDPGASTLVRETATGATVGVCLVLANASEGIGTVGWLAVSPRHRRKGRRPGC